MIDQASILRQSMWRQRQSTANSTAVPRRSVAVIAGKGGVGTTTVAVQLATAWAQHERHVCIVDADTDRNDVAYLLHIPDHELSLPQRTPLESWFQHTHVAPSGPHVASASSWSCDPTRPAQLPRRLLDSPHPFAAMVIDVGYQALAQQQAWCQFVSHVVLVTTPDTIAILDSYALLKRLSSPDSRRGLGIVCNQVADATAGQQAVQRLCESTHRFLGWTPDRLGQIPLDDRLHDAGPTGLPLLQAAPTSRSARAIEEVAARLRAAMNFSGNGNFCSSWRPTEAEAILSPPPRDAD